MGGVEHGRTGAAKRGVGVEAARSAAFWVGTIFYWVPRPALAVAAVVAGWLAGRLLTRSEMVTLRLILLATGTALALFILLPMMG